MTKLSVVLEKAGFGQRAQFSYNVTIALLVTFSTSALLLVLSFLVKHTLLWLLHLSLTKAKSCSSPYCIETDMHYKPMILAICLLPFVGSSNQQQSTIPSNSKASKMTDDSLVPPQSNMQSYSLRAFDWMINQNSWMPPRKLHLILPTRPDWLYIKMKSIWRFANWSNVTRLRERDKLYLNVMKMLNGNQWRFPYPLFIKLLIWFYFLGVNT